MRLSRMTASPGPADSASASPQANAGQVSDSLPEHAEGALGMAEAAAAKRELDLALSCFTEALALVDSDKDPGYYGIILHDIADAHAAAGNLQEAVACY